MHHMQILESCKNISYTIKKYYEWTVDCFRVIVKIMKLYSIITNIIIICLPLITSILNAYVNDLLSQTPNTTKTIIYAGTLQCIYNYIIYVIQFEYLFRRSRITKNKMILQLELSKVYCGISIPGINQKQFQELTDDYYKLGEFIFVAPIAWTMIVTMLITIYKFLCERSECKNA